jgi:hypothetical protein
VEKEKKEMQSFEVNLISYRLQSFSESRIMSMIDPAVLTDIKSKDEHPFFQAYTLCHEGVSTPKLLGETARPITWTKKAIQSLKNIMTKGVKFFLGHNKDNSTTGRRELGRVVADTQEEIDGKLHHIVVGYFPKETRDEVKKYDVNSQEGIWNFFENAGQLVADSIDKLTGIALGNSSIEKPAFSEARKLGFVQAFDENTQKKETTGDVRMTYEEMRPHLNFDMLKRAVKEMNGFPWQIFDEQDLKNDRKFGKYFEELETLKANSEKLSDENKNLLRKSQLIDAKDRLANMAKEMNLTEKQAKFVNGRFSENLEDLSQEGIKTFLDNQLDVFKEVAGYIEKDDTSVEQQQDVDPTDVTKAANNPLLEEDITLI